MKMSKRKQTTVDLLQDEEERYFLNPESVSVHLYCSICQDVFSQPQRAPCGHSFCQKENGNIHLKCNNEGVSKRPRGKAECILPWLKNSRTCPEDRKPVTINQLHHDFILENIIGDQMVACPYRKSGCDFIGQLQRLASHKKSCDFNPHNLPDFLKKSPSQLSNELDNSSVIEDEHLPTPGKPSLKMRLFRGSGSQKQLLMSMFDEKEKKS